MALLGELNVGDIVQIKEAGVDVNYIIVHKGKPSDLYDDSCNGVWLLRGDIHSERAWDGTSDTTAENDYENSDIKKWLNNTFITTIDESVRAKIKAVKIPFVKGTANDSIGVYSGTSGLSCKIFLLSGYEVGFSQAIKSGFPIDGSILSYFEYGIETSAKNKRIANLNGSAEYWYLRSPIKSTNGGGSAVWKVTRFGSYAAGGNASYSYGIRPTFILPISFDIGDNYSSGSGESGGDAPSSDDIVETGDSGSTPISGDLDVTISGVIPVQTGDNWLVIDKSGDFTFDKDVLATIWLVGGGSDGTAGVWNGNSVDSSGNPNVNTGTGTSYSGAGGDGGYVYTAEKVKILKGQTLTAAIAKKNNKSGTTLNLNGTLYQCNQAGYTSTTGGTGGSLPLPNTGEQYTDQSLAVVSGKGTDGVETPYGFVGSSGGGGAVCNGQVDASNGVTGGNGAGSGTNHRSAGTDATNYGCGGGGGAICGKIAQGQAGGNGKQGCIIISFELYTEESGSGNGVGIKSIEQTTVSTEDGGVNVWTVTLTNGTTHTFEVRNGSKGDKGDKGDKGEKGDTGLQGEQGIQGEKGDKGEQGIQGEKGDKGDKGDKGEQGIQGIQGEKGDRGEQGLQGIKGDKGDKGDTGATGLQGERGADGVGISDITQKGSSIVVSLSDGTSKTFRLPTANTSSSGGSSSCGCNHSSSNSGCSCGSGSSGNSRCTSYDVQKWGENWLLFDESGEYSLTMDSDVNMTIYLVGGGSDGEDGIYYNRTAYGGDGGKGGMVNIIRDIKVPKGQADIDVIIGERGNFGGTYVVINNNGYCCNSSGYTINDGGFQGISGKYAFRNAGNGSNGIETPFGYVGSSGGGGAAYCNGKMSGYGKGGLYAGNGGKIVNGKSTAGDKATGYGCGGGGGAASSTSWCKGGRGKRGCVIITWNT